ncbi:Leukocyte elastase inhibitor A [Oryzias melastigma]|uniref:Serpin B6 n=1 Tax=Oryzias melastigma TaxID=30732 RepID=A0A834BS71_ORYME|nr:Leukocyte elastase inhibitor A [Oryzias melastigma]
MASTNALSKANINFSLAMLRQLSEDDRTANIFFSPFSISSALAMVLLGARGDTATQMAECLKMQDCQEEVHTLFQQLLEELNRLSSGFLLSVANRLYGEQSFLFLQEFLEQTSSCYNAELESVDFRNKYEEARIQINSWVEKQTQGKIKDVLSEGTLSTETTLVLVNAIYFMGSWDIPFLNSDTHDAQFKLTMFRSKSVKMMKQKSVFRLGFVQEVNCQILEMPYKENELSMLIFLPKQGGLKKLEKHLTYEKFTEWTHPDKMPHTYVKVRVPRFKLEETYDLNRVLTSMGMVEAFDRMRCNFSGMSGTKDLFLSQVTHKAFVEVNEEGTEAAAATAACLCGASIAMLWRRTPTFTADHPFLFFIRHNSSMTLLFAGRFCSPGLEL